MKKIHSLVFDFVRFKQYERVCSCADIYDYDDQRRVDHNCYDGEFEYELSIIYGLGEIKPFISRLDAVNSLGEMTIFRPASEVFPDIIDWEDGSYVSYIHGKGPFDWNPGFVADCLAGSTFCLARIREVEGGEL